MTSINVLPDDIRSSTIWLDCFGADTSSVEQRRKQPMAPSATPSPGGRETGSSGTTVLLLLLAGSTERFSAGDDVDDVDAAHG